MNKQQAEQALETVHGNIANYAEGLTEEVRNHCYSYAEIQLDGIAQEIKQARKLFKIINE